jgi:hypothetical protein
MSGLAASPSTSFQIDPIAITSGVSSFTGSSTYSWVIADDTSSTTAFNSLIASFNTKLATYGGFGSPGLLSVTTQPDGVSGEDLVLDYTDSAPEPTSSLLFGIAAAPLLLGRRRRAGLASK